MIISRSEGARQLGLKRQSMDNLRKKNPLPGFFVPEEKNGKTILKIDDQHPEWIEKVKDRDQKGRKEIFKKPDKPGPKKKVIPDWLVRVIRIIISMIIPVARAWTLPKMKWPWAENQLWQVMRKLFMKLLSKKNRRSSRK